MRAFMGWQYALNKAHVMQGLHLDQALKGGGFRIGMGAGVAGRCDIAKA